MGMIRCDENEHSFDSSKYKDCPYCAKEMRNKEDKTSINYKNNIDLNKKTEEVSSKTTANWNRKKLKDKSKIGDSIDTVNNFSEAPVAGWLVIIEGEGRGKDFRVTPAINKIGRGSENSISIDMGDNEISRDAHCIIEFDSKNSKFYLERGSNSTYLNNDRVAGDGKELKTGDIIEIGATKIKFISFCSAEFCWDI